MEPTQISAGIGSGELLDALTASGLLSPPELDRASQMAAIPAANGISLAQALVASGTLTAFQAEAFCNRNQALLRIGNYDVLDRLGEGGMGTVFKARHRRMKRIVALKVLSRSLADDESFVQRFQREVETIACVAHPNIVMAYDADEAEVGHFLVMEFVDGQDLASFVEKRGALKVPDAIGCILQAARGLESAHSHGIVHRDIKPANLLRDAAGVVKVADLGLARFGNRGTSERSSITQAGSVLGTVDYMPPEQAMDATEIDQRADIYSLGATLHFLLYKRPPYQGESLMATLLKHKLDPIPSLASKRPDVPPELDAVFQRMMAKDPSDRFQTMSEVVRALEDIEARFPTDATRTLDPAHEQTVDEIATPDQIYLETSVVGLASPTDRTAFSPGPASLDTCRVLLVEPSRTQSAIIRKYLQDCGVQQIGTAGSGEEALRAVRAERPDAIISSLHLSDMTGVQLAQQVRAESQASPPGFVLISSESESAGLGSLSNCGQAVVLKKPFTTEQLIQALRVISTPAAANRGSDHGSLHVLIADDSPAARRHVRSVLGEMGFVHFVESTDGAQAIAAVAMQPFDLIVTDYNMPFLDGQGLVGYLRQNPATAAVPIIMVTTETDPAKLDAVRRLGVTAICDKSFDPAVVRPIIEGLPVRRVQP